MTRDLRFRGFFDLKGASVWKLQASFWYGCRVVRMESGIGQGFRTPGGLQRYVSCQSAVRNCFSVPIRRRSALQIRYHRMEAFDAWNVAASIA